MQKTILAFYILLFCISYNLYGEKAFAQSTSETTSSEDIIESITTDLPEAEISCRAGGSLGQLFRKLTKFKSKGNVFFIDKVSKEIAIFENAVIEKPSPNVDKLTAKVFIKIPNISRENIVNLLLKKQLVVAQNAKVILAIKLFKNNSQETYLYESIEEQKNTTATVFAQVKKLRNITFNNDKFFSAEGTVKVRFPNPPKKIDTSGNLIDTLDNGPGTLECKCNNCPVHDFDLTDLKDAFDSGLVGDITKDATSTPP